MTERLRRIMPDEMSAEQLAVYETLTTGRRAAPGNPFTLLVPGGGLTGPSNAWLLSPPLGRALERVGGVVRYELVLSDRAREICILQIAYGRDSAFEQYAHVAAGRAAGLSDVELTALAAGREPDGLAADEHAVHLATAAMMARGTLDDGEYAEVVGVLGERGLFELVILVGWYQMLATQLAVFAVEPPS